VTPVQGSAVQRREGGRVWQIFAGAGGFARAVGSGVMAAYVESSINARNDLCSLSTQTLKTIESLDAKVVELAAEVDKGVASLRGKRAVSKKKKKDLRNMFLAAETLSERKAQVAVTNYDLINQHICQVDVEIKTLEKAMRANGDEKLMSILGPQIIPRAQATGGRRRNRNEMEEIIPQNFVVDPNEPVYCLCRQVAYGEMIACDNEECAIEWFHYSCVNLNKKPRSTWLCPDCSRRRRR